MDATSCDQAPGRIDAMDHSLKYRAFRCKPAFTSYILTCIARSGLIWSIFSQVFTVSAKSTEAPGSTISDLLLRNVYVYLSTMPLSLSRFLLLSASPISFSHVCCSLTRPCTSFRYRSPHRFVISPRFHGYHALVSATNSLLTYSQPIGVRRTRSPQYHR